MIELSMENELTLENADTADDEFEPAKDLITSFIIATKNYALYPEDNEISRKSVDNVATRLNEFFDNHGDFRFHVKGGQILFHDQVVHEGEHDVGNMAFILFRDGIQWVEFEKGVELSEISDFFKLINQNRDTFEESEGDLVTALWEARFPHVRYEASDIFLEGETVMDFSHLRVTDPNQTGGEQEEERETPEKFFSVSEANTALWALSPDEIDELRKMVVAEENRAGTGEVLDVMMAFLKEDIDKNDLEDALGFLREEFRGLLSRMEFQAGIDLLRGLRKIYASYKTGRPWAIPALKRFFKEISGHEVLNALEEMWPNLETLGSHRRLLWQLLILLPSEAIPTIGPLSLKVSSLRVQAELLEVIAALAGRNMGPFERLLNDADKALVERFVPLLKDLKGERPSEILLALVHNSSDRIRARALDTLIARDYRLLKEVFSLIEDPSDPIRMRMFKYLGQDRNELAEDLLLGYLDKQQFQHKEEQHLLAGYRALGRCGSVRSIPLLRKALLSKGWMPGFKRSRHRRGAAAALKALGIDAADDILNKASRSLCPFVRIAHRKAMEING
ncbi:MAG: HEAT repeat domain-containing protein [Desulfobacteraceae bacterium]|nr:HEAT repeat domain-containing protein [Desulfobacteraceae bacterium]